MVKKKIKVSDILGDNYYVYELTSSNYTPALNGSITITCTMKDVYGTAASGKSITLYQNDTSKGAQTTNSNGIATWSITCSNAGIQSFKVGNKTIEVFVDELMTVRTVTPKINDSGNSLTLNNVTKDWYISRITRSDLEEYFEKIVYNITFKDNDFQMFFQPSQKGSNIQIIYFDGTDCYWGEADDNTGDLTKGSLICEGNTIQATLNKDKIITIGNTIINWNIHSIIQMLGDVDFTYTIYSHKYLDTDFPYTFKDGNVAMNSWGDYTVNSVTKNRGEMYLNLATDGDNVIERVYTITFNDDDFSYLDYGDTAIYFDGTDCYWGQWDEDDDSVLNKGTLICEGNVIQATYNTYNSSWVYFSDGTFILNMDTLIYFGDVDVKVRDKVFLLEYASNKTYYITDSFDDSICYPSIATLKDYAEDKSNKTSSWNSTTNDTRYPTEKLVKDSLDGKQEELVSGTNLKTLNGVDLLGEGDIAIDVSCGEDSTIIFEEDGSVDNSSTLFGEHISLRNSGTGTATYNNNGYYVITNTKASAECFIELPLLQGIYNKSFKVTVRSQGTTTYSCPIGLYYYLDDNNWGGVKDEIGNIWTSAKTNGVFAENSTATDNSNNVEVVSEFIFDVDENTLTVNDYVGGVLKGTKSMTVPVTLTSSVKWGTTTTWDNNTSRNLYEIKAEYPCGGSTTLYNPKLDGTEPQITLDEDNVFTTGNGVAGGLNQVGYIGDGFDNSTDWELTLTLTTAMWGGGLTILLNPYTIEDATCSNSDKWNCYFQNNNADLLQWLDGAIKINSGSNLSSIGISYTRGTTVNIKIVKEGTTFKYYENGTLKGSYTWAKLGTASKVYIGVMSWGGYAHSFTNVLAKSLYNQVVFNESSDNIIKLGDDIMTMIDTALEHMINNWEDYD